MWRVANGRYSITDGVLLLIVPYHHGTEGVQQAIDHLNARREGGGRRICANCNLPIGRHHKWRFTPESRIEHLHCNRPEEYH